MEQPLAEFLAFHANVPGQAGVTERLEEGNLSYSDLVDQIRFDRATELLQDRKMKFIDIAFELGYAEPANFTKAFKRWTGVSPRQFRSLHLTEQ